MKKNVFIFTFTGWNYNNLNKKYVSTFDSSELPKKDFFLL